jgi:hypothetical protein
MTGATALRPVNAAVSVTSSVRVHPSRAKRSIGPTLVAKAFDTSTSIRRCAAAVRSTSACTAAASPTSTASKTPAVAPATSRPRSRSTSATTTRAPSAANARAVAAPMPDAPPVTITTRPAKRPSIATPLTTEPDGKYTRVDFRSLRP